MRRFLARGLWSMACVGFLGACGQDEGRRDSATKITNGLSVVAGDYPSVVMLFDRKLGGICTGTFINETTVISAAHCTMGGTLGEDGRVDGVLSIVNITNSASGEGELIANSTSIVRNELWDRAGGNVNKYDLSLITFPPGVAKALSAFSPASPRRGEDFVIVGYGLNQTKDLLDGSSAAIKRVGTNSVERVASGFIQFQGQAKTTSADGTNSSASSGDSGGPLFIDGKIAGITSGGGVAGWFSSKTPNLYVDINSPESQAFLAKHLR